MFRLLPVLLALFCGCATTSRNFTSAEELQRLAANPKPATVFKTPWAKVVRWELKGPLPTETGHGVHETSTPWGAEFVQWAGAHQVLASNAHQCVAREYARFALAHSKEQMPPQLRRFITGRCGVAGNPQIHTSYGELSDESAEAPFKAWHDDFTRLYGNAAPGEAAGIAVERDGKKTVLAFSSGADEVKLDGFSLVPQNGRVRITGQLTGSYEYVEGAINLGRTGSARCDKVEVPLPRFEFHCKPDANDAQAAFSMFAREPGRFLGHERLHLWLLPKGATDAIWEPSRLGVNSGAGEQGFLEAINAYRTLAGLGAVKLSPKQTKSLTEVTPHFFAASGEGQGVTQDRIALGVIAGWDVEQEIADGDFNAVVSVTGDSSFVDEMIDSPGSRASLLKPNLSHVALGRVDEDGVSAGLIGLYSSLVEQPDAAQKLIASLHAAREKLKAAPLKWSQLPTSTPQKVMADIKSGAMTPMEGVELLQDDAGEVLRRATRSWVHQTSSLDEIVWPPELLVPERVDVMVLVTSHKKKGEPWVQHVLLLIRLYAGADFNQAGLGAPAGGGGLSASP